MSKQAMTLALEALMRNLDYNAHNPRVTNDRTNEAISALKEAIKQHDAEPVAWKPIETAPKDGRRFLAVDQTGAIGVVWWNATEQMLEDLQCLIDDDGMVMHWMPLPASPQPTKGGA